MLVPNKYSFPFAPIMPIVNLQCNTLIKVEQSLNLLPAIICRPKTNYYSLLGTSRSVHMTATLVLLQYKYEYNMFSISYI